MKNAENIDIAVWLYEIGDPVMVVEKNANLARLLGFISMPNAQMIPWAFS